MIERCAYHESGHAIVAIHLGGEVASLSIDPDWDDDPRREGEIEVHWPMREFTTKRLHESSIQVALAGPAAEMIYTGDPFHPALVQAWSGDWSTAWDLAANLFAEERKRLFYLEQTTRQLHQFLSSDQLWQAIASLADELLAHEWLEAEQVRDIFDQWL